MSFPREHGEQNPSLAGTEKTCQWIHLCALICQITGELCLFKTVVFCFRGALKQLEAVIYNDFKDCVEELAFVVFFSRA